MKIQSIPNFSLFSNSKTPKKNTNLTSVNFEGSLTVKELRKYPLEKKLSHMIFNGVVGDLIVVGKNFQEVHKGLLKSIENINDIIKRILFIKHGGLAVPFVVNIDSKDKMSCLNIGNKNILVATKNSVTDLEPNNSVALELDDVIINGKVNIPIELATDYNKYINDDEDFALITSPESFANLTYDFEDIQKNRISHANTVALSLIQDEKEILEEEIEEEPVKKQLSFSDVGGMDDVLESLKRSVLYPIKYPFAYKNMELNKGIILYGKPGTGKTLVAEALAGESNAEFFKISATDLESKWVGESEAKWRKLFSDAKEKQPSIIFIDEFEAIVKERGRSVSSDHGDKVVNQILSLMSDLEKSDDNIFVIATTNKVDTIDSAIKRSGRFGKQIEIPLPNKNGLQAIYQIHTRNKKIDSNFNLDSYLDKFAKRQFTGADIKHIVNEAHTNSWIRQGIYEKMESGKLTPQDISESLILEEDFALALEDWDKNQTSKIKKRIGYNN